VLIRRPRPILLTGTAVTLGLLATAVVSLVPGLQFDYRSESAHLVLETGDAAIASIVALLLYGRFRRSGSLADLLLAYAMALLATAAIGFVTIPVLSGADPTDAVRTWAPLVIRMLGAALFAAAGLVRHDRCADRRPVRYFSALGGVVGLILLLSLLEPHALPVAFDPRVSPTSSGGRHIVGHPGVLAGNLVQLLLYGIAAVAFTNRASRTGDEFTSWIGAAAGLSSVARINYMFFPSLFSEYVYVGDFLRTACYVTLLIGAAREIETYWNKIAEAAATEERQRMARDLHDGLTQELTYIWAQLQELERHPDRHDHLLPRLTGASARAIDEARRAIAALTRPVNEPLARSLTQAAEEVADRYGAVLAVSVDDVDVNGDHRESLIRIVREAVSNAARHAHARQVVVLLTRESDRLRLVVSDDGRGFDLEKVSVQHGYGLMTMRQRAERSGGRFAVDSGPAGTAVSVVWDV
jgi:signal transduction histidine kinase